MKKDEKLCGTCGHPKRLHHNGRGICGYFNPCDCTSCLCRRFKLRKKDQPLTFEQEWSEFMIH